MTDQLKPAIVRIFNQSGNAIGGGFLVSDSQVITCAHVINQSFDLPNDHPDKPDGEITLDFPLIALGQQLTAEVIGWFPEKTGFPSRLGKPEDIAVLKLNQPLPAGCAATRLVYGNNLSGHNCGAFGFKKPEGRNVPVKARGEIAGKWIQIEPTDDTENAIEPGFSGTAVWDEQLNGVVGMILAGEDKAGRKFDDAELRGAFIIPTSLLVEAWPELMSSVEVVNMADRPPKDFVSRPREYDQLLDLLLNPSRKGPVAITTALRGAGGFGKTTLAQALCHDPHVINHFSDGVLWVALGENPGDQTKVIDDWLYKLTGKRYGFDSLQAAKTELKDQLRNRRTLLVVDDVWNKVHLEPFLQGGEHCAHLITTRDSDTLPEDAKKNRIDVDAMQQNEAAALLSTGIEKGDELDEAADPLRELAANLGEWPLLLKLANGALIERIELGQSLTEALNFIKTDLSENGLTAFDSNSETDRNKAVRITLGLSLKQLKSDELARFNELAVFPEDVDVPLTTIEKFWNKTGGVSRLNVEKLCNRLFKLSLLLQFNLKTIRLHDVIRKYLIDWQCDKLQSLHSQLLDSYHLFINWSELPESEPYLWDYLALHLMEAKRSDELVKTVKDWRYLAKKTLLRKSPSVEYDLITAIKNARDDDQLQTLQRGFSGSSHLFNHCEKINDLESSLFNRLQHLDELKGIFEDLQKNGNRPHIFATSELPDLPDPALIRTLEGHSNRVTGCAFSPDSRLIVSASDDHTLKVWDAQAGGLRNTLEGHSSYVTGCAFSPDGRLIVSASSDHTLKIWDVQTNELRYTLTGHSDSVTGCAFSPDGCLIVSASSDHTLKVWDTQTGILRNTLESHSNRVTGCAFSPDSRLIVSASSDHTLKTWDAQTGGLRNTFTGHSDSLTGCAFSPDGRQIVSASRDETLKVWYALTGGLRNTFTGHSNFVTGCAFSPDGRQIVSASADHTLKIWDAQTGGLRNTFTGHSNFVTGCAFSPDGRQIVSASRDETLKVWDAQTARSRNTLEGHSHWMTDCAFSPDGRLIISASYDHPLKVWDAQTGGLHSTLEGYSNSAIGCAFSPDGRLIVSAFSDKTLKVWDAQTGRRRDTLTGHSESVTACAFSPNSRLIVSASSDKTLKVWDAQTGGLRDTIEGHSDSVTDCAFSHDGHLIASASWDHTLKVWDAQTGEWRDTLRGHSDWVTGCAFSPNNHLIVSASWDRTLKVWDAMTGQIIRTLEGHSDSVSGCAFSPDGRLIISASSDKTLKTWDSQTGECLITFYADGPMLCCVMHGDSIVAGGARGLYFLKLVN